MTTHPPAPIKTFEVVCAGLYETARQASEAGRPVAGLMCTYSPQELFHAAGYLPVRILGRSGSTHRADGLLQAYACSFARSTLDSALAGELDFLSLVVFSHTCDTMQNLGDLWRRNKPNSRVLIVSVPTLTTGDPSRVFFRKELQRIRGLLADECGAISDAAIMDSIRLYERHRQMMKRLYTLRRGRPGSLTGRQMASVILASFLMPIEDHLELVGGLLDALEATDDGRRVDRPRVFVVGSVCQDLDFVAAIEEAGCVVVDDDLCMGSRAFAIGQAPEGDPLDVLAEIYLARTPCPAFYKPGFDPGRHVLEKTRSANADGVIFLLTKFCDPWAFEYPPMNKTLENAGIPTLMLEVEQHVPPPAQFRTRAEAFVELLQAGPQV